MCSVEVSLAAVSVTALGVGSRFVTLLTNTNGVVFMLNRLLLGAVGLSMAVSVAGCAQDNEVDGADDTEVVATSSEALVRFGHYFDVRLTIRNSAGTVTTDQRYDNAQATAKLQEWGLPVAIREPNAANSVATYGEVCVKMTPGASDATDACATIPNFQCNLQPRPTNPVSYYCAVNIFPVGGVVTKHVIHLVKGTNGLWNASYGGGGPYGSWGTYATYSEN
jgi:hypothetical protein